MSDEAPMGTLKARRQMWGGYEVTVYLPKDVRAEGSPPLQQEFVAGDWPSVIARKNIMETDLGIVLRVRRIDLDGKQI